MRDSPAIQRLEELFDLGTKSERLARLEGLLTQALRSTGDSAKRKSDALKEQNAIAAFLCLETAELPETMQFFVVLWKAHHSKALKRACVASSEIVAVTNIVNDDSNTTSIVLFRIGPPNWSHYLSQMVL